MMDKQTNNPCVRCGKLRIVVKTWKEKIKTYTGWAEIMCAKTICPDSDCQKIVDRELAIKQAKARQLEDDKAARDAANKIKRVGIKIASSKKK